MLPTGGIWSYSRITIRLIPPRAELRLPKVVQRHDVIRAVILAEPTSMNLIQLLGQKGIPFAVLGNNVIGERQDLKNNDVVFADDIQGGEDATRYLIELGHRRVCFVGNTRACRWFPPVASRAIAAPWRRLV